MFAGLKRSHGPFGVQGVRQGNVDGVDAGVIEKALGLVPRKGLGDAELGLKCGEAGRIAPRDGDDLLSRSEDGWELPLFSGPCGSQNAPANQNFFNSSIKALRPFLL
jgi:hypothetical protein